MDHNTKRYGTDGDDVFDNRLSPVFDTLGYGGNDYFITDEFANFDGGPGNDTIVGGVSGATAIYWESPSSIFVDLLAGYANDGWGTRDTLTGVTWIQASQYGDTILGSNAGDVIWPGSGNNTVDGRGGFDGVILTVKPDSVRWTYAAKTWHYEFGGTNGVPLSSGSLTNVEFVQYLSDGQFSPWYRLLPTEPSPVLLSFDPTSPKLDASLVAASQWKIAQFGLASRTLTEQNPSYSYPTPSDTHPAGMFTPNPHNAVVGDFNGDGREDIWISWASFPHLITRQTPLLPSVLINSAAGLEPLPSSKIPSTLDRNMAYRHVVGDFNGDGIDDVAFGASSLPISQPNGAVVFQNGVPVDISARLSGQEVGSDFSNWGFSHDAAAGDMNSDGVADFYAGGRLWISDRSSGTWNQATSSLPAGLPRNQPMSSAIGDLNGDGRGDLVVSMVADWPWGSGETYALLSHGTSFPDLTLVKLPPLLYGANSKANYLAVADLNADGLGDIVIANTRINPYYVGAALQIIIQISPGVFEDETSLRIDNTQSDASQGEGQLRIFDANGDGLIDVVHSLDSRGANVFLNDGLGHFSLFDLGTLPLVQQADIEGLGNSGAGQATSKMYPIDIDSDGLSDFVSYVSLDNYATSSGNTAILYSIVGNEATWGRDRAESLNGTRLADHIRGYGGNDSICGVAGNDIIDGGMGMDTAIYSENRANFVLTKANSGFILIDNTGNAGTDTLLNIERIKFSDSVIALDVGATQSAGETAMLLGTVLPGKLVFEASKRTLLGAVIDLFDHGYGLQTLSGAVMRLPIWDVLTGKATPNNTDIATYLLTSVYGAAPDATTLGNAVATLNTETDFATQGNFLWHLAESATNQMRIDLVGLSSTGLVYSV